VVLFDGFDEISPMYKEIVIDLLQALKNSAVKQLWVTTRPHMRVTLEDKLQQFSYTLEPFSEENQIAFLTKFWQQKIEYDAGKQERLEIYPRVLLKHLAQLIRDREKEFTGIPLQTKMLAEVFEADFKAFYQSQQKEPIFRKNLYLLNLYDHFVNNKFNIFYEYKIKISANIVSAISLVERDLDNLKTIHQKLALEELFNEQKEKLFDTYKFENKEKKEEFAIIGLTDISGDKPRFIHRTFAEYFAALWLTDHLKDKQTQELLLTRVLIEADDAVIRSFLNGQLSKSSLLDMNLDSDVKSLMDKHLYQRDIVLHEAAREGHAKIVNFLLNTFKAYPETLKVIVAARDEYDHTALHLAVENGHVEVVDKLLESVKAYPKTLKVVMATTNFLSKQTPLHLAAENGHVELVDKLLNSVEAYPKTLNLLVAAKGKYKQTALHQAVENGHVEVVDKLLERVKAYPKTLKLLVAAKGKYKQTALQLAVENSHVKVVVKLLESVKAYPETLKILVEARDEYEQTALHQAVKNGHFEVIVKLLESVKAYPETVKVLVAAKDENEQTALHLTVKNGHVEVIDKLLESVKAYPKTVKVLVAAKDENEQTALHLAVKNGHVEVIDKLLENVKAYPEILKVLVEARDEYEQTALHLIAKKAYRRVSAITFQMEFFQILSY
jgi:ankyrin repeat protein